MSFTVAHATDDRHYVTTDHLVWFEEEAKLPLDQELGSIPVDQRFAAQVAEDDRRPVDGYPGIYGVRPMDLGVPGGRLPVAGLTWVGVHPDHRRRGVLSAMLRDHFERTRDAGVALSVLHASEPGIYGRFGYGLASLELTVEIGRGTEFSAPSLDGEAAGLDVRLAAADGSGVAARMRTVDLRLAETLPGIIVGSEVFYDRQIRLFAPELRDKEPPRVLFAQHDGEDVGYATFRRTHKWDNARPNGTVSVGLFSGRPAVRLALLRRLVDLDLMGKITLGRVGPEDPIFSWVGGPRATSDIKTYDSLWVRLADLAAAWGARSFEADCDVVVEVSDKYAPWNAGRWRLTVSGGRGGAERSEAAVDLSLDVNVLGAGYLGRTVAPLLRAGQVSEHRAGAWSELTRAMRTEVEPEPSAGF